MSYCAICTSERGPFSMQPLGKDDALVQVCTDCDAPVFEPRGTERGYEPRGGLPTNRECNEGIRRVLGADHDEVMAKAKRTRSTSMRPLPPGWRVHRVFRERGMDSQEAYEKLKAMPWFGPGRVKYIGTERTWFIWGYAPDAKLAMHDDDPFAPIRHYQVRP